MANNPVANLLRAPELKEKVLFTLFILLIYRTGAHITVPGLDVNALRQAFGALQGTFFGIYDMFVGGGLSRATILALGIMPYISASIMFQLLAAVFPQLGRDVWQTDLLENFLFGSSGHSLVAAEDGVEFVDSVILIRDPADPGGKAS